MTQAVFASFAARGPVTMPLAPHVALAADGYMRTVDRTVGAVDATRQR